MGSLDVLSTADTTVGSGVYNKPIVIQRPVDVPNVPADGGTTRTWTTVVSTWGHISSWKGLTYFEAGQQFPKRFSRILVRYRASLSINAGMRVLYGKRIYLIRDVDVPAEALTTIVLLVEELQAIGSTH